MTQIQRDSVQFFIEDMHKELEWARKNVAAGYGGEAMKDRVRACEETFAQAGIPVAKLYPEEEALRAQIKTEVRAEIEAETASKKKTGVRRAA